MSDIINPVQLFSLINYSQSLTLYNAHYIKLVTLFVIKPILGGLSEQDSGKHVDR